MKGDQRNLGRQITVNYELCILFANNTRSADEGNWIGTGGN